MPRSPSLAPALLCLIVSIVTGCLFLPGQEQRVGDEAARQVQEQMPLLEDPGLTRYVDEVGQRLSANARRADLSYRFQVLDDPIPNAFALPGGYVYVTRGLLLLTNREDELAGVIGHEIGHVEEKHAARRSAVESLTAPFALATGITGIATSVVSPQLGVAVFNAGETARGGLVVAPFSRQQERDADEVGLALAARSGWEPDGLPRFLTTMEREEARLDERFGRTDPRTGLLASHPATAERIRQTERRAAGLARSDQKPIAASREDYLRRLDGLLVGDDPRKGSFVGDLFLHPELDFRVRFPKGWKQVNTDRSVGAAEPGGAFVTLQLAGRGDHPKQLVQELERAAQRPLEVEYFEVGGLPVARSRATVQTGKGPYAAALVWIAKDGLIYQVSGLAPVAHEPDYRPVFAAVVESFGSLRDSDRDQIRVSKLRVAYARAGETVGEVAERTGSTWDPEEAAIANALEPDTRLAAGTPLKMAIAERYEFAR